MRKPTLHRFDVSYVIQKRFERTWLEGSEQWRWETLADAEEALKSLGEYQKGHGRSPRDLRIVKRTSTIVDEVME